MALSIQLDPDLEALVTQEAQRLGVTESEFVAHTLAQVLHRPNPAALLKAVRSNTPMGDPAASEDVSFKVREKLRAQRPD